MQSLLNYLPDTVLAALSKIPLIWWWYAMNFAFLLGFLFFSWAVYYSFRRAFGYEKFKGVWYSPASLQNLKQELYDGVREGRLPDKETMAFLDRHIYGRESALRKLSGNDWI